ncbi:MAG: hypothetical protein BWZ10_00339 [candidate division BRC1 bacterium ADurb.BinA364]|nr:MAG: hypothetical protein BWZ10_00339 [candidate division BRC1 bacterium ADurb.BinA364]
MSYEFTDHEKAVMEKMTLQKHKDLMAELESEARKSFEKNVKPENIGKIESWIGTDEQIEGMLFWDKGGKFDDPEWHSLKPADPVNEALWTAAKAHFAKLRAAAVKSQRIADLTLYSYFNPGLLYTGVAPAVRDGGAFKGVEFRVIGSVETAVDSLTIAPVEGGYKVAFGACSGSRFTGVSILASDNYSLTQLMQLIDRRLAPQGFEVEVQDQNGKAIEFDKETTRAIRRELKTAVDLGWGEFLTLQASKTEASVEAALATADLLVSTYYDRFGLERECLNIGKVYGNFAILREDNFQQYLPDGPYSGKKGLILLTATLVCRRCRRELKGFRDMAKNFPNVQFALVNLNSPQFTFYKRVFGDIGGGDPDEFRKTTPYVTPFIIAYAPDENGVLKYVDYYGTKKDDHSPEYEDGERMIKTCILKA